MAKTKSKSKKKKVNETSIQDMLGSGMTTIYLAAMLGIFPAFYTDKLFRIAEDKKQFFLILTGIYGGILLFLLIGEIAQNRINRRKKRQLDVIFIGILLAAILFSTIFALDREEAFYGLTERRIGALVMLGCVVAYLGVKKYGRMNTYVIWSILLGSAFMYLCGILHACGINFLHLKDNLAGAEIYLTPIGNSDFNATYACLMLPIVMGLYLECKEKFFTYAYGCVCYMGFLFILFIKTDSSVLGTAAIFLLLLYQAVEEKEWMKRYLELLTCFCGAMVTIFVLRLLFPKKLYAFHGIGLLLLRWESLLAAVILILILWFLWKKCGDFVREKLFSYRRRILYGSIGVCVAVVLFLLAVNTVFYNLAEASALNGLLLSDDSFVARGYIWIRTIREFSDTPWINRIFGHGLNCFYQFITPHYRDEMMQIFQAVFVDPHNEFLQVLVTMGVVGAVGYFGLILVVLVHDIRSAKESAFSRIAVVIILVYLLQGLVNIGTIYCLPIFFCLLGLAGSDDSSDDRK